MKSRDFTFHLGHVWIGNVPEKLAYRDSSFLSTTIQDVQSEESIYLPMAIKLSSPRFNDGFGILGATFTPRNTNDLTVRVGFSEATDDISDGQFGLPREFAEIVLQEAVLMLAGTSFGHGELLFNYSAWHPVSSNDLVFRVLTRALIHLIPMSFEQLTEDLILGQITSATMDIDKINQE